MWQARRALSPAVARQATGRANEDIVVPRSLIPDMLERVEEIQKRCGLEIISFGHAGDGNIHTNILFEKDDPSEVERAEAALRDLFRAALDLGGTISGEHGVGTTKKDFIDMELQPQSLDLMRRIKAAFDPAGIMNPGKIFPHDVKPLTNP
jgi:glycolate oxidase